MAGYPLRIEFIRQKEDPIENILHIYRLHYDHDCVEIYVKGPHRLIRDISLSYMIDRLPPCLFFCCGQSDVVNMKRVKSCCLIGRRIRLTMIGNKHVYVGRLHIKKFLWLLTIYPGIDRAEGFPPAVPITQI